MKSTTIVFIESPRFMIQAEYLKEIENIAFITNSKECFLKLSKEGNKTTLYKTRTLNECMSFKKNFNKIMPLNVIIFNDSSPVSFWIQKNFHTILINEDYAFAMDMFTLRVAKNLFIKPNPLLVKLFQFFSQPKVKIDNKLFYRNETSIMRAYLFLIQKIIFGYEYVFNFLPGRHSAIVAVNNHKIKDAYLECGFSKEKIFVTGSIGLDARNEQIKTKNSLSHKKSVDVIFFTQPFNKYSIHSEFWKYDIESFTNDCEDKNISYLLLLHPRDNRSYYEQFTNTNNILSFEQRSPQQDIELVESSKLVVLKATSTIELPLKLEKPICYINYSSLFPDQNVMNFFHHDMILYKNNNIDSILKNLETNKLNIMKFQNFKYKENYPYQSQSISKIVELLK